LIITYLFPGKILSADSAPVDTYVVFNKLDVNELMSNNPVYSICTDSNGYMWIGGAGGLYRFDGIECSSIEAFSNKTVWPIYDDSQGTLWIGTVYDGLYYLDRVTGNFISYTHDPDDPTSISDNYARIIYEDSRGVFWIGTNEG
jgi:ligand-binding sensor domain-containing protein